ncbi:hypothetical protein Pelo_18833 [Pelomyxa schiedti]|nr:hypothetical protein Pelo_18833 [Pelomyxa schiedti]
MSFAKTGGRAKSFSYSKCDSFSLAVTFYDSLLPEPTLDHPKTKFIGSTLNGSMHEFTPEALFASFPLPQPFATSSTTATTAPTNNHTDPKVQCLCDVLAAMMHNLQPHRMSASQALITIAPFITLLSLLATTSGHISSFGNEFSFRRQSPVNTSSAASSSASPPQYKVVTVPIAPDSAQHRAIPPDTPATSPLTAPSMVQAALPPPPDSRFGWYNSSAKKYRWLKCTGTRTSWINNIFCQCYEDCTE